MEEAMDANQQQEGLAWKVDVWDGIANIYLHEIDRRFAPSSIAWLRATLQMGEHVLA